MSAFLNNNGQLVERIIVTKQKCAYWAHASLIILHFAGLDIHTSFEIFDEPAQDTRVEQEEPAKKSKSTTKQAKQTKIDDYEDVEVTQKPKNKPVNLKRLNSSTKEPSLQTAANKIQESPYFGNKLPQAEQPDVLPKKRKLEYASSCFSSGIN